MVYWHEKKYAFFYKFNKKKKIIQFVLYIYKLLLKQIYEFHH